MPLCGFNKKMLDGLELFSEGLWEQAFKRAKEDHISLEDSLKQEIAEMDIFREILKAKNPQRFQALHGIALFAQALYRHSLNAHPYKESYDSGFKREQKLFQDIDAKYYDELRPKFGPTSGLQELGKILEQF